MTVNDNTAINIDDDGNNNIGAPLVSCSFLPLGYHHSSTGLTVPPVPSPPPLVLGSPVAVSGTEAKYTTRK